MTTGKTIALTRQTFVGKAMSLLFNMLSRLIIAFLPKKEQASFNLMAAVTICSDFGAPKNKWYGPNSTMEWVGQIRKSPLTTNETQGDTVQTSLKVIREQNLSSVGFQEPAIQQA